MSTQTTTAGMSPAARWALILALAALAFFASYRYASARSATPASTLAATPGAAVVASTPAGAGGCCGGKSTAAVASNGASTASSGGGCCGGGATAPASATKPKAAAVAGDVQKISVDVSKGYYDPSTIQLKAGVPAEITFSQASGCTGQIQSADLGFSEDLSTGPKTVKLGALKAGTYSFYCGMQMVFGSIVVK
ncbi:MAG TPA: cupredoxin domain-containing protein [Coriobacteriia bacterium]